MYSHGDIPFVRLLLPFVLGALAAWLLPWNPPTEVKVIFQSAGIFLLTCVTSYYKQLRMVRRQWLSGAAIYLCLFLTAHNITGLMISRPTRDQIQSGIFIMKVDNEPVSSQTAYRLIVKILSSPSNKSVISPPQKAIIFLRREDTRKGGQDIPDYGDIILLKTELEPISPPLNPGEFDYRNWLSLKQIHLRANIISDEVLILEHSRGNRLISAAIKLRRTLIAQFRRFIPSGEAAEFASTLILGYRADLSADLVETYSRTGTMHVLSVSGMHVALIFGFMNLIFSGMDRSRTLRFLKAVLIVVLIWAYAMITGFSAPANRAAVMISMVVFGTALNRRSEPINTLSLAAFLLLVVEPLSLFDVGFQLSFLAVLGLIMLHPVIYRSIIFRNKLLDHLWSYTSISLSAQFLTLPLTIYHFHQIPLLFLISNILIVGPITLIMYAGILLLFLPADFLKDFIGDFMALLIVNTNNLLAFIESQPGSLASGLWINLQELILLKCAVLLVLFWLKRRDSRLKVLIFVICIGFALNVSVRTSKAYTKRRVVFFSLRNDSAIAYLYEGKAILITTLMTNEKSFSYSVLPTIQYLGSGQPLLTDYSTIFQKDDAFQCPPFMQFRNFRILKWDQAVDRLVFPKKFHVDAVLITGNPQVSIDQLYKTVSFSMIVLDGTNSNRIISRLSEEALPNKIPVYNIKKCPALILNL